MPWLPVYIDESDARELLGVLNADPEIAFLVPNGPNRWIASASLQSVQDGRHCLWHVPSGALPLLDREPETGRSVDDPWAGWTERRAGADPTVPYFGAGHPGVIWWNVRCRSQRNHAAMGMSGFEWIGNHYRIIGSPAPLTTEHWWKRLRHIVKRRATRIPRVGRIDGQRPEIWAFPSALEQIARGVARDANP